MSLRGFHIFFVTLATATAYLLAWWGLQHWTSIGIVSLGVGLLLTAYGVWFARKVLGGQI